MLEDTQFQRLMDGQDALQASFAALASDVRTHEHSIRNVQQNQVLTTAILEGRPNDKDNPGMVLRMDRIERTVKDIVDDVASVKGGFLKLVIGVLGFTGTAIGTYTLSRFLGVKL